MKIRVASNPVSILIVIQVLFCSVLADLLSRSFFHPFFFERIDHGHDF